MKFVSKNQQIRGSMNKVTWNKKRSTCKYRKFSTECTHVPSKTGRCTNSKDCPLLKKG